MSFITDTSTQLTANYTQNSDIINNPNLLSTNFITSNILTDVLLPYDTKALRTTALNSYTTTTALTTLLSGKEANLTFNAPLTRSTNTISLDLSSYDTISARNTALASYTNTTTTASTYINSNQLASQKYINSNSIDNIILYYISSNTITNLNSFYVSSNTISKLNSFFISSNNLKDQKYINSNSISDIVNFYISSNLLSKQNYMNSNSIDLNYLHIDAGNNISVNGILKFGTRVQDYLIDLYGGTYGFGVNASTLRYNSYSAHKFYSSATNTFTIDTSGNVTALATINGATLQQGGVGVSTLITNALSGYDTIALRNTALASYLPLAGGTVSGTLTLNTSTQLQSRINLTGQEFYQATNTSTDGIALLLGVNRTGNRQLWIGDTANLTQNATNSVVRIQPAGIIDCIATNGTTSLPLYLNGSAIWLSAPTQCSSSLGVTGTLNATTLQQGGTGVSTLITNALSTYSTTATIASTYISSNQLQSQLYINSNSITNILGMYQTLSSGYLTSNQEASQKYLQTKLNGYVGIGTTNPSNDVDIWGTTAYDGTTSLRIYNNASTYGRTLLFMIGRYEGGNDGWNLSSGRNSIVFGSQSSQGSSITYTNAIQVLGGGHLAILCNGYSTNTPAFYISNTGGTYVQSTLNVGSTLNVTGATTLSSTLSSGAITSSGEIRSNGTSFVGMGASWDHFRIWHDGTAMYLDAGGAESGIVFRIDNTSVGYPASSYPEKMRLYTNGDLSITGTNFGRLKLSGGSHDADKRDVFSIGRFDGSTSEFTGMKCNVVTASTVGETYDNQSFINFWTWGNNIAGAREVMRISQRGRVGIGSTLPVYALDTVGEIRATNLVMAYAGGTNGYITMTVGNSSVTGYLELRNASGTRMGYIGNVSAGGYIQLQSESTSLGYSMNGKLTVGDTTTLSSTLSVTGTTTLSSTLSVAGVTTLANGVWHKSGEGHNRFHFSTNDKTYFGGNGYTFRSNNDGVDVFNITDGGAVTASSTIIASGAITGQQYVNNYSTLYSTTVGGAYGIFYPVTRWLSNGSTFFVSYTIKIFTNGGGSVETTGTFWGNSTSGIVGATASWSNGIAIASEPFYDSGTFYWRFFNSSLSLFGGYSYYKFIG